MVTDWHDPVTLTGYGVRLEPLAPEHAPGLLAAAVVDPGTWRWLPAAPPARPEDMQAIVTAALDAAAAGRERPFTILAGETIVGSTRYLEIQPAHRALEVGWTWLSPAVRRTHVNTACKRLLLADAFERLAANRVQLKTDIRNERSQRAIERLGAAREGVLRQNRIRPDGTVRDTVMYSIISAEWPAIRARLDEWLAPR